jgi:hypothetical protein
MAKVFVDNVRWICDTTSGLMEENQGVLYISPVVGLGMTYPYSKTDRYVGMNPKDVPSKRYQSNKATDSYGRVVVYQQETKDKIVWDDKIRARIHELHEYDPVSYPFDAYNKINNPAHSDNNEALIDFDFSDNSPHWAILNSIINEVFGLSPETDLREPWIPRDAGTPYGQDLMVTELADKTMNNSHVGFNGHTGLAKTMIAAAALQGKIFPTGGVFCLFSSPIGDTLEDVDKNFSGYYYPGSDRLRKVIVYREKDLTNKTFSTMRTEANDGAFIVFVATVQDMRHQDDPNNTTKELRVKYQGLLSIDIDVYVRDEVQTNYGGAVTSEVLDKLNPTYIIDTSASINKLIDLYHPDAIVDRGIFWALQYEKDRGTPHIHIETLSGLAYDMLDPNVKDMYNEEDGWTPAKMTERLPNGQLRSLIAIDQIWSLQYIDTADKEDNPLSIINDLDLPYQCRRVGIHVFPEGVKGTTAREYLIQLANDANSMPKWNKGKAIFITPYDYDKHATSKKRKSPQQVIDALLETYEHVIICTHRMWIVGSNILPLAHVVQWDPIRDPYNQEQLYPGRPFRVADWKTDIKIYDLAPGHTLEISFSHLAKVTAKLNKSNPDPKELLKNISFKHYIKNIGIVSHDVEDVYGKYNHNLLNKVKSTPPIDKIAQSLGLMDIYNLTSSDISNNQETGTGDSTTLTEDTKSKKFVWQETSPKGRPKGKPQEVSPIMLAKKINSVMLEIPAFAVLDKLFSVEEALSHWAIRKMFGEANITMLMNVITTNSSLKNIIQNWLTEIHQAYQSLPFEELHDYVFKNTIKKKEAGIVFIGMKSASWLAQQTSQKLNIPKNYSGVIGVVNALSGSVSYCLKKVFPKATVVCVEEHTYYVNHLLRNNFEVNTWKDLNMSKNKKKIKYWFLNPPYQKDASGLNDDSNKQGSFWYQFVDLALSTSASTADAKYFVVSPNSVFGAGNFGKEAFKVQKIREYAEFVHIYPDLTHCFPGIGIPIAGYVLDKEKKNSTVTIEGYTDTIEVDGKVPVPFIVSPTAKKVLDKCFMIPSRIPFKENTSTATKNDVVMKVNGGRFKIWKKSFVGYNKDTSHNAQGAILPGNELTGYQSAIKSKLWEYMFKILGGERGNSVTTICKHLPVMNDMTVAYSDQQWFDAFGIDIEMQADIDKFLQEYK